MGPWGDGAGTFPSRFAANMVDVLNFTYRELKSDQVQQLSSLSQLKSARRDYAVTYTDIRRTASNEVRPTFGCGHRQLQVGSQSRAGRKEFGKGQYTKLRCFTYKPFT